MLRITARAQALLSHGAELRWLFGVCHVAVCVFVFALPDSCLQQRATCRLLISIFWPQISSCSSDQRNLSRPQRPGVRRVDFD